MSKYFNNLVPILVEQKKNDEYILIVESSRLLFVLNFLKKHFGFRFSLLSYIAGVDLISFSYRFCVVYDLLSVKYNSRLRIKVFLTEITPVFSCVSVFINANWWEREVWDMFGIYFEDHPDLRRILTDYGFEGYPLRKDFPLSGYLELSYNENKKQIVVEPLELSQDFRFFNFEIPW